MKVTSILDQKEIKDIIALHFKVRPDDIYLHSPYNYESGLNEVECIISEEKQINYSKLKRD